MFPQAGREDGTASLLSMPSQVIYKPEELFRIETNRDFAWHEIPVPDPLRRAVESFGLNAVTRTETVSKRNPTSVVHRVASRQGSFILRSVDGTRRTAMEQQCCMVTAAPFRDVIKPIRARSGTFSVSTGNLAWMAYVEKSGNIFSGAECPVEHVVERAIALQNSLLEASKSLSGSDTDSLPRTGHHPEKWQEFFVEVSGPGSSSTARRLRRWLAGTSVELL